MPKYQQSAFAKLRCGLLPLSMETGRYNNVNIEKRICEFCLHNELEDENHFVCRCKNIFAIDNICIIENVNFISMSDKDKITYLMKNSQCQLCKYTWLAYTSHRNVLYN